MQENQNNQNQEIEVDENHLIQIRKDKLKELQEDKRLIKKLYNSMELKPTKTKLAENIGISRIKLSKILNDYKEIKKKD